MNPFGKVYNLLCNKKLNAQSVTFNALQILIVKINKCIFDSKRYMLYFFAILNLIKP